MEPLSSPGRVMEREILQGYSLNALMQSGRSWEVKSESTQPPPTHSTIPQSLSDKTANSWSSGTIQWEPRDADSIRMEQLATPHRSHYIPTLPRAMPMSPPTGPGTTTSCGEPPAAVMGADEPSGE